MAIAQCNICWTESLQTFGKEEEDSWEGKGLKEAKEAKDKVHRCKTYSGPLWQIQTSPKSNS